MKNLSLPPDKRPFGVLCLGLNACDHLCPAPRFPRSGEKLFCLQIVTSGGGQSATAACALARLGHSVAYAGVHGDDEPGKRAGPWLKEFGVDTQGLVLKPGTRSQEAFILVEEEGGERTIIWTRDPECHLHVSDLDMDLIAGCRVLHLDGHFVEASIAAARHARKNGVIVSLDGEKVTKGTQELVSLCDVVMGCEDFAQRLIGQDDPRSALEVMASMGPAWVGRTRGIKGAEMLGEGGFVEHPGFKVHALDTTGAGDVFHGGMVHALLLGQGPREALATTNALAAISVTGLGGRSALATAPELKEFMAGSS